MNTTHPAFTEKQPFPEEKFLTISASEYVGMVGKELSDYIPQGVWNVEPNKKWCVPDGAEVVVGYTELDRSDRDMRVYGTALIPKNRVIIP